MDHRSEEDKNSAHMLSLSSDLNKISYFYELKPIRTLYLNSLFPVDTYIVFGKRKS